MPDGSTFTDIEAKDFRCGNFKSIKEVNGTWMPDAATSFTEVPAADQVPITEPVGEDDSKNELDLQKVGEKTSAKLEQKSVDNGAFFDNTLNASSGVQRTGAVLCTATIINDRWILSAAHCHDDFG